MTVLYVVLALAVGVGLGYLIRRYLASSSLANAEREAERVQRDAKREAETVLKEARLEAKEEVHRVRTEVETELRDRRAEVAALEQRMVQREEQLEARAAEQERRDQSLRDREANTERLTEELNAARDEAVAALERISGLSPAQARDLLLKQVEDDARHDMAKLVRQVEEEARREADRRARNILSLSIQRTAANHVAETTVTVVPLPSDDMKGRIIGREGRNIRALEAVTGIDCIIDDTPEAVVLSGFDGVRREIARLTLTKLIADGRIHPARIEEMYEQSRAEVEAAMEEAGEQACFDTNVHGVAPELVKVLGRLKFRTSYGQNVLNHSVEVAHLAGLMAAELGANIKIAKRAGLLHDVGKAVDHEVEGSHADISQQLAKKYRESQSVVHAIHAHHQDVEPQTIEAVLVQAADAVSAARPGARRESLENYIKRLEALEEIAEKHKGVEKCYAMQAGREVRVMVKPAEINDNGTALLAREIAKEIEEQLDYPGQIRVTVIRESRATELAK
ncbi:MAG: ribonuclease Y [Thermoleophilia bacterium]|jgi:ribonuclease Y|nr:ribonuclease Y [Thermoleophilia bacterium]